MLQRSLKTAQRFAMLPLLVAPFVFDLSATPAGSSCSEKGDGCVAIIAERSEEIGNGNSGLGESPNPTNKTGTFVGRGSSSSAIKPPKKEAREQCLNKSRKKFNACMQQEKNNYKTIKSNNCLHLEDKGQQSFCELTALRQRQKEQNMCSFDKFRRDNKC
ncbi:hypothetical protein SG34_030625 [Thalassomonas viridans]|uniref:Uncharacterized protein n=1 Tax=Thalassomonas viridans TaxID=137584 RepID=A0AAE9Z9P8_9GAMM|nr:hypothetical protein [Thalassomonas viridans]WDE09123.1 hypothetical protein SG34_030625 [Thalassomonas viridans]